MKCPRCGAPGFSGVCDECGFPVTRFKWIGFGRSCHKKSSEDKIEKI